MKGFDQERADRDTVVYDTDGRPFELIESEDKLELLARHTAWAWNTSLDAFFHKFLIWAVCFLLAYFFFYPTYFFYVKVYLVAFLILLFLRVLYVEKWGRSDAGKSLIPWFIH